MSLAHSVISGADHDVVCLYGGVRRRDPAVLGFWRMVVGSEGPGEGLLWVDVW